MISQAVVVVAQIFMLPRWGRLGDRIGNRAILAWTAAGVAVIPFLWYRREKGR